MVLDHAGEHEVGGAVEDARDFVHLVGGQALVDGAEDRDAAAHACLKQEVKVVVFRNFQQLVALGGHQLFVGGDDVLPREQAALHEIVGRVETAHGFHHDADVRIVQNVVELLGELVGIGQVGKLPQIQNPPDFDGFARLVGDAVRVFAQHLRHAGTHHAVTQNRYINHADDHPFLKGVAAYLIYS